MISPSEVSKICFGCEPLGGVDWGQVNVHDIASAVIRSLELGLNFFDTADVYGLGMSESRLAEILGVRRHDVVIATKGGMSWSDASAGGRATVSRDSSPRYLQKAVEDSLRRLRLDRIPIYFIHWPDPRTEIRDTFEFLTRLQDAGKIVHIGCSNFSAEQVRAASEVSKVSFVQLPVNLLGEDITSEMAALVKEKDIRVVAYNVLANGLLTGKFNIHSKFAVEDRRARLPLFQGELYRKALRRVAEISDLAASENLTCAQYAINTVLRRGDIASAILGIKNRAQIEENFYPYKHHSKGNAYVGAPTYSN
jgi:myo-inositol catabolism protein IolS